MTAASARAIRLSPVAAGVAVLALVAVIVPSRAQQVVDPDRHRHQLMPDEGGVLRLDQSPEPPPITGRVAPSPQAGGPDVRTPDQSLSPAPDSAPAAKVESKPENESNKSESDKSEPGAKAGSQAGRPPAPVAVTAPGTGVAAPSSPDAASAKIHDDLARLTSEIDSLGQVIARRDADMAAIRDDIRALRGENRSLREAVTKLQRVAPSKTADAVQPDKDVAPLHKADSLKGPPPGKAQESRLPDARALTAQVVEPSLRERLLSLSVRVWQQLVATVRQAWQDLIGGP